MPTVADGHVYVGSQYSFSVFGLFAQLDSRPGGSDQPDRPADAGPGHRSPAQLDQPRAVAEGAAATGIEVLRSTDGVNFTMLTTVSASATSYSDPGPLRDRAEPTSTS